MKIVQGGEGGVIEMVEGGGEGGKESGFTSRLLWRILGETFCREARRERMRDLIIDGAVVVMAYIWRLGRSVCG